MIGTNVDMPFSPRGYALRDKLGANCRNTMNRTDPPFFRQKFPRETGHGKSKSETF